MVPLVCRAWIAARRTPLEGSRRARPASDGRPAWRPDGRRPAGPARPGLVRRRRLRRAVRDRLGAEPAARRLPRGPRGHAGRRAARRHAPAPGDGRGDGRGRRLVRSDRGRAGLERVRPPRRRGAHPESRGLGRPRPPRVPATLRAGDAALDRGRARRRLRRVRARRSSSGCAARSTVRPRRPGPGGTVVVVSSGGPIATACASLADPDGTDPATFARPVARFNTVS